MYSAPFLNKDSIEDPQVATENGCETAFYFNTSLAQVDIFALTFDFAWVPYLCLSYATSARYQLWLGAAGDARKWGDDYVLFPTQDEAQAWHDQMMLTLGVMTPDEIARSRFEFSVRPS